jgi:hypothetical protein
MMNTGLVFCAGHWNALPRELRDGIYAAKRKPEKYAGAQAAAIAWLSRGRPKPETRKPIMPPHTGFITKTACLAHEVNRAYCLAIGDTSQLPWDNAPPWQKDSAVRGVQFALTHPDATPEDSHVDWLAEKARDGWVYGLVKDAAAKTHPCFVPYAQLPVEQRVKDHLFQAVVRTALKAFGSGDAP